jgi:hypothetical protein
MQEKKELHKVLIKQADFLFANGEYKDLRDIYHHYFLSNALGVSL